MIETVHEKSMISIYNLSIMENTLHWDIDYVVEDRWCYKTESHYTIDTPYQILCGHVVLRGWVYWPDGNFGRQSFDDWVEDVLRDSECSTLFYAFNSNGFKLKELEFNVKWLTGNWENKYVEVEVASNYCRFDKDE